MSFPRYHAYKDSGVEWLGMVPTHWDVAPFKRMVSLQNGSDHKHIECEEGYPVIGSGGPFAYASEFMHDGESVLLGRKGTIDKPLYVSGRFWTVDTMYWSKIQTGAFGRFAYYSALTIPFGYYSTNTALPSMTKSVLEAHLLATPSESEQIAIAGFLDRETAKIDALVAEQEQLITLLKEKRQAVISHAVTKGLDPSVPMKDSGVEWLGEVPAHWWATTLRRCARSVETGGTPAITPSSEEIAGGVNWFTPGDFSEGLSLENSARQIPAAAVESGDAKVFPAGSVLIVSIGATLGKVGLIMQDASANQQINAVIPGAGINSLFLAFSLSVRVDAMKFLSNASTIGIMNQEKTKDIPVAFPPESEQVHIAAHIAKSCVQFDALINEATNTVTLLQERRSALISAAVTGQIDVRGLASVQEQAA